MILEILNIFVIPLISLSIYSRRMGRPIKGNGDTLTAYAWFAVVIAIISFVGLKITERLINIDAQPSSQFYTVISCVVAFLIPYVYEVYKKYIDIKCDIEKKNGEND